MSRIRLGAPKGPIIQSILIPRSKSESNRALILQALSGNLHSIEGLSEARDTQTLKELLDELPREMNVGPAGTAMRFLTAYLAIQPGTWILGGSERLNQRPIGPLVEALKEAGAVIEYVNVRGYPPLRIKGDAFESGNSSIEIPGDISSQFITALLMVGPSLKNGLKIRLKGDIFSRPYIEMTRAMMDQAGVSVEWRGQELHVPFQEMQQTTYSIGGDWSAASYWYAFAALNPGSRITLKGLRKDSPQGDGVVADIYAKLGIQTRFLEDEILIQSENLRVPSKWQYDFLECPDLAQTVVVTAALLGIEGEWTGLESLRIKETDRIAALQQELRKMGIEGRFEAGVLRTSGEPQAPVGSIQTYEDHRMAMAFAQVSLKFGSVRIEDPDVVGKSYPGFWKDLEHAGFQIEWK